MASMELDCWKGDWGLPRTQIAGAPIKLRRTNNPWWSRTGELPTFRSENRVLHKPIEIINYLKDHNFSADQEVPEKDQMTAYAFSSLVEYKLLPALLYTWWMDAKNYVEFTRVWYAKALPFPFNFFIPGRMHKAVIKRLESSRGGPHVEDGELENILLKDARECLNLLAARLGDKDFFYGNTPTFTDAILFGHIAPLLKAPFPSSKLQNHLKGCPNLCAYCGRILQRYFPPDPEDDTRPKAKPEEKPDDPFEDPHKLRNQILSVGFAAIAMVAYALLSGLVQVEFVSEQENDEESSPPELEEFEFDDDDDTT
ncbi:metaxin-1-like [Ptychodera flava]|uniref:metaxin-1-like n=1 Tax=Ptychodera flava TaxID=63121 RepID=UPI00396AA35C